jgi:hypothetical protein
MTLVKYDMTNVAHFPSRLSRLALLSVWIILLAWAAPAVVAVTGDLFGLGYPMDDRTAEQSETADVTDDPVLLFSSSRTDLQPLTFSLHATHLIKQTWAPAPPVRPPIIHA